ncbi:MAG TPA: ABC transporter ATP-binding protein [Solirubrobacterales bacterium]|nr:ABC transporter ATP-binding protein [Solirubrobacterales bacterium]
MTNYATSLESPSEAPGLRRDAARAPDEGSHEAHGARQGGLLVSAVTKGWGERTVLAHTDLRVDPGTSAWVGGHNGVGKTTLLRIVAGLLAPDQGEVSLDGLDPFRDRRSYQRRLGFLSAGDRGLYARLTVRSNLQLWTRLALLSGSNCESAVDAAIEAFALGELADRRADRLSLGQRQRVRLALAFLHSPRLVLLDEPANSLDDHGLSLIATAVTDLHRRGGMTIWCSPNRPELEQIGRGYVLNEGRLSEDR